MSRTVTTSRIDFSCRYNRQLENTLQFFLAANPVAPIDPRGPNEKDVEYEKRCDAYDRDLLREFCLRIYWGVKLRYNYRGKEPYNSSSIQKLFDALIVACIMYIIMHF